MRDSGNPQPTPVEPWPRSGVVVKDSARAAMRSRMDSAVDGASPARYAASRSKSGLCLRPKHADARAHRALARSSAFCARFRAVLVELVAWPRANDSWLWPISFKRASVSWQPSCSRTSMTTTRAVPFCVITTLWPVSVTLRMRSLVRFLSSGDGANVGATHRAQITRYSDLPERPDLVIARWSAGSLGRLTAVAPVGLCSRRGPHPHRYRLVDGESACVRWAIFCCCMMARCARHGFCGRVWADEN